MGMEIIVSVALLFVGIVVLVFIHVCIVGRALRSRNGIMNGTIFIPNRSQSPMSQEDIKKLPCFEYKLEIIKEEEEEEEVDCAVCLESFKVGDKCRLLKCNHCFHAQCIDSWLKNTAFCPICRAGAKASPLKTSSSGDQENTATSGTSGTSSTQVVAAEMT
ncbi:PREDICTED: RING-H2 finger protein ATL64-like [Ipomoea nil]|uniref:RING-H2 finger protein ATL64-like n=1 Tax=Ipomoea nil TaxID=35883 RepID=UPI000901CE7A|nr:PREDICTED: RING-H2 finger protein ATL64-like [Ipomoea nil]